MNSEEELHPVSSFFLTFFSLSFPEGETLPVVGPGSPEPGGRGGQCRGGANPGLGHGPGTCHGCGREQEERGPTSPNRRFWAPHTTPRLGEKEINQFKT